MSELADDGTRRIEWAKLNMPLLGGLRATFENTRPFAGKKVVMGLHIESKTAVLAELLMTGGADLTMIGSPGTTDDSVAEALRHHYGVEVLGSRSDSYAVHLDQVKTALSRRPELLLDNGADLIAGAIEGRHEEIVAATEETTSGASRLRGELAGKVPFPVIVINDSPLKQIVENEKGIGPAVLDGFMRATNTIVGGRTFCVVGYGSVGRSMARTLRALNATVLLVEIDPIRALEAAYDGMLVMPLEQALPIADTVITLTGHPGVIAEEHLPLFKNGAMLANVGHFSTEIDLDAMRRLQVSRATLGQHIEEFRFGWGKAIRLLANGEMLNLAAATGHPIEVMDVGFALQAHSLHLLASSAAQFTAGDHLVPHDIDERIALDIIRSMPAARWDSESGAM